MSNSFFFNGPKNTVSVNQSSESKGLTEQALYGIVVVFIVYLVLFSAEMVYLYLNRLHANRTELV